MKTAPDRISLRPVHPGRLPWPSQRALRGLQDGWSGVASSAHWVQHHPRSSGVPAVHHGGALCSADQHGWQETGAGGLAGRWAAA